MGHLPLVRVLAALAPAMRGRVFLEVLDRDAFGFQLRFDVRFHGAPAGFLLLLSHHLLAVGASRLQLGGAGLVGGAEELDGVGHLPLGRVLVARAPALRSLAARALFRGRPAMGRRRGPAIALGAHTECH